MSGGPSPDLPDYDADMDQPRLRGVPVVTVVGAALMLGGAWIATGIE